MENTINKTESHQIAGAASILEFCKIVALDLGFNTEDVYWTTNFGIQRNRHVLTLISEASIHTVVKLSDQELADYSQCIGAEKVRDRIRQTLFDISNVPFKFVG